MNIAFIGCVEFSEKMLLHLIALDAKIVGVVTKHKSSVNSDFRDLSAICERESIPCLCTNAINERSTLDWLRSLGADVIFCLGWSALLNSELLKLAPMGVVGFHPAALPENRGRHPIIWALALGLDRTASTFFFMDEGADSGDILSQELLTIHIEDNARNLYDRIVQTARTQITTFLPKLAANKLQRFPQNHARANVWRKRNKSDGVIDWRMSAVSIRNLVRALTRPYVGAHCVIKEEEIKVWRVELEASAPVNIEPGRVMATQPEWIVKCGEGALRLVDWDRPSCENAPDYL